MGQGRNWTKEDDEYLREYWGVKSIQTLSKNLNRSINAINVRKVRLGLGPFLDNGEYITYSQLLQAIYGIEDACCAYRVFKKADDFPIHMKRRGSNRYKIVYLDEFWEWAEKHKRMIDFSKMEENILGMEPEWVKKKRKIDFICRLNTGPWTWADDEKLKRMLSKHQYTYTDLAAEFNRTEGAIKRRICTLGLTEKPIKAPYKPWAENDIQTLVSMCEEGWGFERIGAKLKRSALSCRGKAERIEHPEYTLRSYRNRDKGDVENKKEAVQ